MKKNGSILNIAINIRTIIAADIYVTATFVILMHYLIIIFPHILFSIV